jgi:hypothetical protein
VTYDIYRNKNESSLRVATRPSAGLPSHFKAEEWELLPAGSLESLKVDFEAAAEDIEDHGFYYFRLV